MQINNMQKKIESLDPTCKLKTTCHFTKYITDKTCVSRPIPSTANITFYISTVLNKQLLSLPILAKYAMKLSHFRFGSDIELYIKRIEMFIENVSIAPEHQSYALMS